MNVKEYFVKIEKIAAEDKAAACAELVKTIHDGTDLPENALNMLMDKLEEILVDGTPVYASVTQEGEGSANFHYIEDANGGKWIYALLSEAELSNINETSLFTRVGFLTLIDLLIAADNNCGIELIASADKSLTAPPAYIKDLADRIIR